MNEGMVWTVCCCECTSWVSTFAPRGCLTCAPRGCLTGAPRGCLTCAPHGCLTCTGERFYGRSSDLSAPLGCVIFDILFFEARQGND
jgi:hypothetical protein